MKYLIVAFVLLGLSSCKKTDKQPNEKSRNNTEVEVKKNDLSKESYKERGLKYALSTQAVLGKNLMGKIQKEGTIAALEFCNEQALPLTDSMSVFHNATLKRVTDKPRNPINLASSSENEYIKIFKEDIKSNKDSEPIAVAFEEKVTVYYPIITNGMCLQCHGTPTKEIEQNTFDGIKKFYPKDAAIGYNINEVRGIWSVTFDK